MAYRRTISVSDRFDTKTQRDDETGCLVWVGGKINTGYGVFSALSRREARETGRDQRVLAHRYAWERANGKIPDGMVICHRCDNPPCVEPDHLFLGSMSDNMQDMAAKGRGKYSHLSKMDKESITQARQMIASGMSNAAIGRHFGIDASNISRMRHGILYVEYT